MTSGIVKDVKYARPWLIIAITPLLAISLTLLLLYQSLIVPLTVILISVICGVGVYSNAVYNKRSERAVCGSLRRPKPPCFHIHKEKFFLQHPCHTCWLGNYFFFYRSVGHKLIITAIAPYNTRYGADTVVYTALRRQMDYKQITSQISAIDGIGDAVYIRTAFLKSKGKTRSRFCAERWG